MKDSFPFVFSYFAAGLAAVSSLALLLFLSGWLPLLNINGAALIPSNLPWFVNVLLIVCFGLQHSVMARQPVKDWVRRRITPKIERSTYVFFSGVLLLGMIICWQPLPAVLWQWQHPLIRVLFDLFFLGGWILASWAVIAIDLYELIGFRQVGIVQEKPCVFRQSWLHQRVRHPIYSGFIMAFWMTPDMTVGHLLFAVSMTIYIRIGIHFEERHLVHQFGDEYLISNFLIKHF